MYLKSTVFPMVIGIMLLGFFASPLPAAEIITEKDIQDFFVVAKEAFKEMGFSNFPIQI